MMVELTRLFLLFYVINISNLGVFTQIASPLPPQPPAPPQNTLNQTGKPVTPSTIPPIQPIPTIKPANHKEKPKNTIWPGLYNDSRNSRHILGDWLLTGCWNQCPNIKYNSRNVEYEGYDGWYNNMARPDSGAVDKPMLRRWPAAYEDGSYAPSGSRRPNPFILSHELLRGGIGTKSKNGRNAFLVFFGQQVVEEILDVQRPACPPEYFNIPVPKDHPISVQTNHTEMPLLRTRYDQTTGFSPNNPRQQLNEITPYFDGGLFYGISKQWSDRLRTYANGTIDPDGCLASSHDGLFPEYNTDRLPLFNPPPPYYHSTYIHRHETEKVSRFFKLGNPRGNENTFLLSYGVMWFRWHNYLAKRIRRFRPTWSSEKVYNEARKWVIATQQKITLYDWLPVWTNTYLEPYTRYDPSIDPQIDHFFQTAAFRFGHTLVVPGVYLRDYTRTGCEYKFNTWGQNAVRTCNSFWRPQEALLTKARAAGEELIDIDRVFMGMTSQLSEREDHEIVEDLRGNVFGPLEFPRRDLMAINIQRARDHGLPDFNTARMAYGLPKVKFSDFKHINQTIMNKFKELYKNSTDDIDIWIGGILETDSGPGTFFKTVIKDQFTRIRDGDRFWFENPSNQLFSREEVERIKQINIYDVLMAVTKMDHDDIPRNPFNAPILARDESLIIKCKLEKSGCLSPHTKDPFDCYHLPQLNHDLLNETCEQGGPTYDYFKNSELSYILTFIALGVTIAGGVGAVILLIKIKEKKVATIQFQENKRTRDTFQSGSNVNNPLFVVHEWQDNRLPMRRVIMVIQDNKKQLAILAQSGEILRAIDFSVPGKTVEIYQISDQPYLIIKCLNNYDLVVQFESGYLREQFLIAFESFLTKYGLKRQYINTFNLKIGLKRVVTKKDRQKLLEKFYRVVFAQAFNINYSTKQLLDVDQKMEREISGIELTRSEFAESISMRPDDDFVLRIFNLVDKDRNGFISFREFVDLLIIFANGSEKEKAKLLFDMYDINAVGYLTIENFSAMIKSFLATVGGFIDEKELQSTIDKMMKDARIAHKDRLEFSDFLNMCGDDVKNYLGKAKLNFQGVKKEDRLSYLQTARDTLEDIYSSHREIQERFKGEIPESDSSSPHNLSKIIDDSQAEIINKQDIDRHSYKYVFFKFIELKNKEIFWLTLYTFVLLAIFAERSYYYSVEAEHSGLRRIAGYGVTITRGAASAMMFSYSSLLVTMCRNTITYLRDTVANNYFSFDASVEIHKYIAYWAFIFTGITVGQILHIVGHAFNFYHISTQTPDDLTCLFTNYFHATHELPKFHYWCWQTITGITGIILTIIWAFMYIFATNIVRKKIYNWFWYTHSMYPLFFIFMVLHGTGRLIQAPIFYYFFLGPVILFTIDNLISISRKKIEIPVIRAEILPSSVTMLEFRKPSNFQYKAGQWVRIACLDLNKNEYHPFTLSSCPGEENLTVHIRSVGPWTSLIRTIYDTNRNEKYLPKIYLDGPYGEGHQDWNLHDVAILIGGGIGVTPFASILKDIVDRGNQNRCKKVYFIWVSRTQKQFEWLIDIIRKLEYGDKLNIISCHIFVTQFFEKFDLRTIFLYICERHYQRISGRSLFTKLRAVTHFGRPNLPKFFNTVSSLHGNAKSVGVFSCGPPSLTSSVERACNKINIKNNIKFDHHYKNF